MSGGSGGYLILTEADPTVIDADYSPELDVPSLGPVKFAAIVRYGDGAVQWHHVSSESAQPNSAAASRLLLLSDAAEHAGAQLQCFDERSLCEHETRLWNWKRAIAWMTAARGTALAPYMTELAAFIHPRGTVTLGDIEALGSEDLSPLYVAAAFRLVQRGDLVSDLDTLPISTSTTISARG